MNLSVLIVTDKGTDERMSEIFEVLKNYFVLWGNADTEAVFDQPWKGRYGLSLLNTLCLALSIFV